MSYIDPVQVSPGQYRELLGNEHVRVLEMRLAPGQADNLHSHPDETVHFIRGGKARIEVPDVGVNELEIPDGFTMWHEAWTHRVENIGESEILAVIVERRG
jgi:beta-alanine degradation protein BauB